MIYYLINKHYGWLEAHDLGFLRVFRVVTFQAIVAIMISFAIVFLLAPRTIRWLVRQKIGDKPDEYQPEIKKGTPTMGGILIVPAIAITTALIADIRNFYVLMALFCVIWLGVVGAVDDWLKLTRDRRGETGRQGLTSLEKLLLQIGLSAILAYFTYHHGQNIAERNRLYFPFLKDYSLHLASWAFVLIGLLMIVGFSNAVNLTDGMDGLASGCMAITSFTFIFISVIVGVKSYSNFLLFPYIEAADQMAIISGAITGACLGFLWFNTYPALVFMGDTGSLALGGLIGYIAIVIRQELLLMVVGGIFVAEAGSVMLQVGYFKFTKRKYGEGRRIFLMAPLHHHFQKLKWPEPRIVVRFWLITAILAALTLATIKIR